MRQLCVLPVLVASVVAGQLTKQVTEQVTEQVTGQLAGQLSTYHLNKFLPLTEPNTGSYPVRDCLYFHQDFALPAQFSFCFRWLAEQWTGLHNYLTVVTLGKIDPSWREMTHSLLYGVYGNTAWLGFYANSDLKWLPLGKYAYELHTWTHTCVGVDTTAGHVRFYENGARVFDKVGKSVVAWAEKIPKSMDTVTVGCAVRTQEDGNMSMIGKVTDLSVWSQMLSGEEMESFGSCNVIENENFILRWSLAPWQLISARKYTVREVLDLESDICYKPTRNHVVIPIKQVFHKQAEHFCNKLSGNLSSYVTKKEFSEVQRTLSAEYSKIETCHERLHNKNSLLRIWLHATDMQEEGVFRDQNTNNVVEYLPWAANRPFHDKTVYNCLAIVLVYSNDGTQIRTEVRDQNCYSSLFCSLCQTREPHLKVHIRGLCKDSIFDKSYVYKLQADGTPYYLGIHSSSITYDKHKEQWVWTDRNQNASVATSSNDLQGLLLGKRAVNFERTKDVCVEGRASKVIELKITTCSEAEFTCYSGSCIAMRLRCDQTPNCDDGSDEVNCKMVIMGANYNNRIAPFHTDPSAGTTVPVGVSVSIVIHKVMKLSEVDLEYSLKFTIALQWYDKRLVFHNLKSSDSSNALSTSDLQKIWIPSVVFTNTPSNEITLATSETEVTVTRQGNFTRSGQETVEEIDIYEGAENMLTFEATYTKTLSCEYQLHMYPFDKQVCTVDLALKKTDKRGLVLLPKDIRMLGKTILTQYIVEKWGLTYQNKSDPSDGIYVQLKLKRRIVNEILTTYLPSVLILIIVYATNYFDPAYFEALVTVNVTSQLVLTTLFIGVSDSLPKTSYIKMIDIWLIFAQMVPFIEFLLHTVLDYLRKVNTTQTKKMERKVKSLGTSKVVPRPTSCVGPKAGYNKQILVTERPNDKQADEHKVFSNFNGEKPEGEFMADEKSFQEYFLRIGDVCGKVGLPIVLMLFTVVYWAYGLQFYLYHELQA